VDPEDDRGIDFEFINEAVRRFDEDETVKPAFISAVEQLSSQLAGMDVNADYKPYAIVRQPSHIPRSNLISISRLSGILFVTDLSRQQSQNHLSLIIPRTLLNLRKPLFWVLGSACPLSKPM
jgi:hypothetical protein